MQEMNLLIREQLTDENWKSQQNPEFINALDKVETTMTELSAYVYLLMNYFEQYSHAIRNSPIFDVAREQPKSDDVSSAPTQTAASRDARVGAKDHA
jgi:hypothetical protein